MSRKLSDLLLQVSCLVLQTLTIMVLHFSLFSVFLKSSVFVPSLFVTNLVRLSVNFMRCLPLLFFPHILPLHISFSIPSVLLTWPKNFNCLFLMVLMRDLL